jgi:2-polyprenyl-3-methyl-5-hydroxy-6-metoxy-1,4-benzoquinol methylase
LIKEVGATTKSSIIDIGGGASRLVDVLLDQDFTDVTVLDLSDAALKTAKARLGSKAADAQWVAADVTQWEPPRTFDVWHDRAAFHFLTDSKDRSAYIERLAASVRQDGYVIIGTFALDGPEKCSGLPVERYAPESLAKVLGPLFVPIGAMDHDHKTPWGSSQRFQFATFQRTCISCNHALERPILEADV